jgi:hypothetical protein
MRNFIRTYILLGPILDKLEVFLMTSMQMFSVQKHVEKHVILGLLQFPSINYYCFFGLIGHSRTKTQSLSYGFLCYLFVAQSNALLWPHNWCVFTAD